jgi:hypothetical protein
MGDGARVTIPMVGVWRGLASWRMALMSGVWTASVLFVIEMDRGSPLRLTGVRRRARGLGAAKAGPGRLLTAR